MNKRKGWRKSVLTYKVTKYPNPANSATTLTNARVDAIIKTGFGMWEEVTKLEFRKEVGKVDIEISFVKGDHGDKEPFDGPGGTLGHACSPFCGGDVHIDDEEFWTDKSYKGTNLLQTITHELGHSLGLKHSKEKGALMAPFYKPYDPNMRLHQDDIAGIRSLYGKRRKTTHTTTKPKPQPTPNPGSNTKPKPEPNFTTIPDNKPNNPKPKTELGTCASEVTKGSRFPCKITRKDCLTPRARHRYYKSRCGCKCCNKGGKCGKENFDN